MNDQILLVVESIVFLFFSALLFKRERIFGIYLFFLYVYAIFAQIAYRYRPELSMAGGAYFGQEIWGEATVFISLSGISLFLFLYVLSPPILRFLKPTKTFLYVEQRKGTFFRSIAIAALVLVLIVQYAIFFAKFSDLNWVSAQGDDLFQADPLVGVFVFLIKITVLWNIGLYCNLRQYPIFKTSRKFWILSVVSILSFFLFTFKVGNRTDTVAFALGATMFELSQSKVRPRTLIGIGTLGLALFVYTNVIHLLRADEGPSGDLASRILLQDYFAPAHMLFAEIAYHYVDPVEVVKSNVDNSLVQMHHPYLQQTVTDLFARGIATRSQGWAFYAFSEGYMFSGFSGFLYNGLVLGMLMTLWRSMAFTTSRNVNSYLLAVMGAFVVDLVRSQSSYFIKYAYIAILPSLVVYLAFSNQRISLRRKRAYAIARNFSRPVVAAHE